MAQLDRLLATIFDYPSSELHLLAGEEPTLIVTEKAFALVPRKLQATQVRFLIDEILNDTARNLLEANDSLDFGYTPPGGSRVAGFIRDWRGETKALFRAEETRSLFRADESGALLRVDAPEAASKVRASLAQPPAATITTQTQRTPSLPNMPPATERNAPTIVSAGAVVTEFDGLLKRLVAERASDLHLSTAQTPMSRRDGGIVRWKDLAPMSEAEVMALMLPVMPARNREQFAEDNDTDFAYEIAGLARFRVNMFRDRMGPGTVVRVIPNKIASADELGLPQAIRNLCNLSKGLVLVTGPTGSGKSTTLAALIDLINQQREDHIITLEDPIEFVHPSKNCLVNQREVGVHTTAFKRALRAALREDPDILLVGEMRDLETIEIAIETAETGHLVFGTLHTTTAASTIDRVIDQFPADRQSQIRVMLADSLKGVIAQTLCKRIGGGRAAALEVLLVTPAVSNLIREGKTFQVPSVMQTSRSHGMSLLNDSLNALVQSKTITPREAHLRAIDKAGLLTLFQRDGTQLDPPAAPAAPVPVTTDLGNALTEMSSTLHDGGPHASRKTRV